MWNTRTPHAHDVPASADGSSRRSPRAMVVAAGLSLVAVAVGCAVNPVTRRPELAMVSRSTELELGSAQAKTVAAEMGLLEDAAIAAYVRTIGARLAARSPRTDVPYAFHVVDTPEPNAFAIPGHVYVTRGLLVLLNDEDELAGVLAHEVGHIAARHAVQRLSRALPAGILTGIVSGVTGLASPLLGSLFQAGGDFATDALLAPYSREQEREADRVGQEIAARAGWDPIALAHALAHALAALERFEGTETKGQRRPSFLDAHPSTPERARNTAAYAATLVRAPAAPTVPTRGEFLARLDGLVVGPSAAQGVFDGKKFLHPDLGFHLRFPTEWKTANAATQVAGMAGDGRTIAVLSLAAEGNDPMLGVRAFERSVEEPIAPRVERTTIDGLPAAHLGATTQAEGRRVAIEIWWVALGAHVYQLTGLGAGPSPDDDRALLAGIAESFGALTPTERAGIREDHVRLVQPKPGETLALFTNRTGTPWSSQLVAIANGLATGTLPAPLRPLKVAVREPYSGKPAP